MARWKAAPSAHILMAQDPETRRGIAVEVMESKFPKAHSYLSRFEKILRTRAAFRRYFRESDPYWSMFNVSPFTFAPWKVVWREVANEINAAVVGEGEVISSNKAIVPDHTCILVECKNGEEAHYICAVINSSPARLAIRNYIVLHPDPHVLGNVKIPIFSGKNRNHKRLSALSHAAHIAATKGETTELECIEAEIDQWAAKLWNLSDEELAEIRRSLEES